MCPKEIGMATGALEKVSSSDVSKRFGFYYDEAMTHPLAVERNGAVRVVMLPAAEYERLARLDHVALLPSELEPADLRAIRDAEVPASAQELNHLLD
jgi:PHD/YefM family antitoxin component YafN of YafNO toxin-antitoxin module